MRDQRRSSLAGGCGDRGKRARAIPLEGEAGPETGQSTADLGPPRSPKAQRRSALSFHSAPTYGPDFVLKVIVVGKMLQNGQLGIQVKDRTVTRFLSGEARRYGWRIGDEISQVNGIAVATQEQLQKVVKDCSAQPPLRFSVMRRAATVPAWPSYQAEQQPRPRRGTSGAGPSLPLPHGRARRSPFIVPPAADEREAARRGSAPGARAARRDEPMRAEEEQEDGEEEDEEQEEQEEQEGQEEQESEDDGDGEEPLPRTPLPPRPPRDTSEAAPEAASPPSPKDLVPRLVMPAQQQEGQKAQAGPAERLPRQQLEEDGGEGRRPKSRSGTRPSAELPRETRRPKVKPVSEHQKMPGWSKGFRYSASGLSKEEMAVIQEEMLGIPSPTSSSLQEMATSPQEPLDGKREAMLRNCAPDMDWDCIPKPEPSTRSPSAPGKGSPAEEAARLPSISWSALAAARQEAAGWRSGKDSREKLRRRVSFECDVERALAREAVHRAVGRAARRSLVARVGYRWRERALAASSVRRVVARVLQRASVDATSRSDSDRACVAALVGRTVGSALRRANYEDGLTLARDADLQATANAAVFRAVKRAVARSASSSAPAPEVARHRSEAPEVSWTQGSTLHGRSPVCEAETAAISLATAGESYGATFLKDVLSALALGRLPNKERALASAKALNAAIGHLSVACSALAQLAAEQDGQSCADVLPIKKGPDRFLDEFDSLAEASRSTAAFSSSTAAFSSTSTVGWSGAFSPPSCAIGSAALEAVVAAGDCHETNGATTQRSAAERPLGAALPASPVRALQAALDAGDEPSGPDLRFELRRSPSAGPRCPSPMSAHGGRAVRQAILPGGHGPRTKWSIVHSAPSPRF